MDYAFGMRSGQPVRDLDRVIDGFDARDRTAAQPGAQCFSIEQLRNQEERTFMGADIVNRQYVRVADGRSRTRFEFEAPQPVRRRGWRRI